MGWGRTLLLGDVGTQMNVVDLENQINALHNYLNKNREFEASQVDTINRLVADNHKLKLCIGTLARVLLARNLITADELGNVADMIDDAAPQGS